MKVKLAATSRKSFYPMQINQDARNQKNSTRNNRKIET